MKRKLVGILSACLALSLGGAVLAACAPTEPEVTEGAIYVTEAKSFWAGVGSGYLSFEYKEEPETPAEGERYGYVFHVMVDSGDGYSSYMSGNWELECSERFSSAESKLFMYSVWMMVRERNRNDCMDS